VLEIVAFGAHMFWRKKF